jgi:hypothetical protein
MSLREVLPRSVLAAAVAANAPVRGHGRIDGSVVP